MPFPTREEIQFQVLDLLKDDNEHTIQETIRELPNRFPLSKEELEQKTLIGRRRKFATDVYFSVSNLRKAGLLENRENTKGIFKITADGHLAFTYAENNRKIDKKILERFPRYVELQKTIQERGKRIKKKKEKRIKPKKGIIILVDALGTKGMWRQASDNKKQMSETDNMNPMRQWGQFIHRFKAYIKEQLGKNYPKIVFDTFSDTIRIVVETNQIEDALIELSSCLHAPLITSIAIGRPLRGCITAGVFFREEQLIVGQPIDEAAEYHMQPQWIGISASPRAHIIIDEIYKKEAKKINENFYEFDIPLTQSIEKKAWALRWPDFFEDMMLKDPLGLIENKKEDLYEIVRKQVMKIQDMSAALKWRNTLAFYEECLAP